MKKIHFIGICGVGMGAIAIAFKKIGWQVTGSDVGFYPPISTKLINEKIEFYPGWHPENMIKNSMPDLVVVGNVASSNNPEWQYVKNNKIEYKSYPKIISDFFIKNNSLVCSGTYGKTTTSALLSWILSYAGLEPSYMFGGLTINNFPSAKISDSDYSIIEGDEYKTSKWDNNPKFFHYSPTHLILTSVIWDHADIYPTEKLYKEEFRKLIKKIPANGLIAMSEKVGEEIVKLANCKIVKYGKKENCDYRYLDIKQSKNGIDFKIIHKNNEYNIKSSMLGEYSADNITACFAMAIQIGIEPEKILKAIEFFKGMKRRLEKRAEINNIVIFDDIAHSPTKAKSTLENLRKIYQGKIFAVFEPNTGNRQKEAILGYDFCFNSADEIIIPKLTKIKFDKEKDLPLEGDELAKIIGKTHNDVNYIDDDRKLISYLTEKTKTGDVIVFLGSHGFRGMIEKLVEVQSLKSKV